MKQLDRNVIDMIMAKASSLYTENDAGMLKAMTVFSLSSDFIEHNLRGDLEINVEWIDAVVERISKWVNKNCKISDDMTRIIFSETELAYFLGVNLRGPDAMFQ